MKTIAIGSLLLAVASAAACTSETLPANSAANAPARDGTPIVLTDTTMQLPLNVSAVAQPVQSATLSTKVMGAVTAVLVHAGDRVNAGQPLLRLDARELHARRQQIEAGVAAAEAVHREAELMARRMRSLYVDSAAPKAQVDAAEAGLARALSGIRTAQAGLEELSAIESYAELRAPFGGVVTQRFVDVGALAAPGMPLLTVEDHSRLRVSATTTPDVAAGLVRGAKLSATIEGVAVFATVEGVAPAPGRSLTVVNAIVTDQSGALVAGGAAQLAIPGSEQRVLLVPESAIRREGDLTGVTVRGSAGDVTRWITPGRQVGTLREVLSGLRAGETILVPPTASASSASSAASAASAVSAPSAPTAASAAASPVED